MILQPSSSGASSLLGRFRNEVILLGVRNGVNDTFTTPDIFIQTTNLKIKIYWNGRKLSINDDYTVSESGGLGTGYDTIVFLYPKKPTATSKLEAEYWKA